MLSGCSRNRALFVLPQAPACASAHLAFLPRTGSGVGRPFGLAEPDGSVWRIDRCCLYVRVIIRVDNDGGVLKRE